MEDYSAKENYFSEEGMAESTESLMEKLEAASDRETYKARFHNHGRSTDRNSGTNAAAAVQTNSTRRLSPLLVTALAILIGAAAGILLSMYVI